MLNSVIKSTMKRVNNSSVELLPRVLKVVKFNPALQKEENGRKRNQEESMTVQRQGGATSMCSKDILEKWGKLCEVEEEIRKSCWK